MSDNYYLLLELSLDPPEQDWFKLNAKIDEKKREWNQKRNRPDGLKFASLCEKIESYREALKDANVRKRQAQEARRIKLDELDELIDKVADGDSIAPKQVDQLVKTFQNVFQDKTIRDRVGKQKTVAEPKPQTLPPPPKPDDSGATPCDAVTLKKIQDCLDVLKKADVYSALGLARMSSLAAINDAAQKALNFTRNSIKKSSEVSVTGELGGIVKTIFKTENQRKGFDRSWARFQIERKLKPIFNLRAADKVVSRELFERSVQEIVQEGESPEYALWFAYDFYVEKRKCPDPRGGVGSNLDDKVSCPNCFRLNDKSVDVCGNCGARLRVECPKCRTVSFAQTYCPKCGFALGDLENVKGFLEALQTALAAQNFDEASRAYQAAYAVWPENPELQPYLLKLRDLNARQVFDAIERELNAGRLEAARSVAAKLSFDGGDSPVVSQLKSEFERRFRDEKAFEDALVAADSFVAQERYFDASAQLDAAAKIAQSRPVLIEKRNKIAPFIRDARNELAEIRSIQDVEIKERRLNDLLIRRPDFSDVLAELESTPPCAPSFAEAIETSGRVEICWRASVSKGEVRYRIVRRRQKGTSFFDDVCVCDSTARTSFVDESVGDFTRYRYAVYALRNRTESKPRATNVVVKEGAIRDVRVSPRNGGVEVAWNVSEDVSEIDVERRVIGCDETVKLTSGKATPRGFLDDGLQNDVEYEYSATLVYRDANDEPRRTAPFRFVGSPSRPLQRVEDWEVKNDLNGCVLRWKRPAKGDVCFLLSAKPFESKTFQGTRDDLIALFGAPVVLTRRQTSDDGFEIAFAEKKSDALTVYITPVTIDENRFVLGESREIVSLGPIQNVRTQRCDASVYVSWDWTPGVDFAFILWSEIKEPSGLKDPNCRRLKMTRADYEREQAWEIRLPIDKSAFAKIYQVVVRDGKTLVSPPETLFLKKVYVEYYCEERDARPGGLRRFLAKKTFEKFVKFRRTDGESGLPEIVLVRGSGRPPLRRDDGERLATLPATDKPEEELKLDEYFTKTNRDAYFRCYLANPSDRSRFALLDPGEIDLRLFKKED